MKNPKTLASCKNPIHKPLGMSKRQRKRHRQRQRKRQRRSAEGFDVPEDVLLHIFYRLPLKSLVRFKSVNKEWNSLISNPQFRKSYRTRKPGGCIHQLILANKRSDFNDKKTTLFGLYSVYNHDLSRKAMSAAISGPSNTIHNRIKEGLPQDPLAMSLVDYAERGKTSLFWVEDGILYTVGRRLYVSKWGGLRRELIKECHVDSKWVYHPGVQHTLTLVEETYYWPLMRADIESYVRTCLVCQQDKVKQLSPAGVLEPVPIPKRPWESISTNKVPLILLNRLRLKDHQWASLRFMGSYNGLVAIFVSSMTKCNFILWNPLIGEHISCYFPREGKVDAPNYFTGNSFLGLCYDSSSDAYVAVVASRHTFPVPDRRCEIVRVTTDVHLVKFKTGEFTKVPFKELGWTAGSLPCKGVGTVVCGVPHWVQRCFHYYKPDMIIYFSLEEKGFRKMEVPAELGNGKKRMTGLGSLDGERQLSVVLQCRRVKSCFEVWVMKEYGNMESWTKLFVIQGGVSITEQSRYVNPMCVLGLMENGEYLIKVNGVQLWGYDPEKGSSRHILIENSVSSIIANEPSLISPPQPRAQ